MGSKTKRIKKITRTRKSKTKRIKRTKKSRRKTRKKITRTKRSKSPKRRNKKLRTKSRNTSKIRITSVRMLKTKSKKNRWKKLWTLNARANQKHGLGFKTEDTGSVKLATRAKSAHTFATTTFLSRPLSPVTTVSGWTPVLLTKNAYNPSQSMSLISFDQKTTNHLILVITCTYFNGFQFLKLLTINLFKRRLEFV